MIRIIDGSFLAYNNWVLKKIEIQEEISQSMVYGDYKNYLVAIIVPSEDFIKKWCKENNKSESLIELSTDKNFHNKISKVIDKVNENLSLIEKVRKFIIAKEPFTVENSMMTPTLKIRRFKVIGNYGEELKGLY